MSDQPEFGVPTPNKDIYAGNTNIIQEECITFLHDHTEYVPFKGILVYIKDVHHPKKGFPTPEAIFAINQAKVILKEAAKYAPYLFFLSTNKLLTSLNTVLYKILYPHKIKEIYLCPAAYNLHLIIFRFLLDLKVKQQVAFDFSLYVAHVAEYDDAYRYRLQDIATEASLPNFQDNPRKELKRLLTIFHERTTDQVADKIRHLVTPILAILLVPRYKKAFRAAIPYIKGMSYDADDLFWVHTRADHYNFLGLPPEERHAKVEMPQAYRVQLN